MTISHPSSSGSNYVGGATRRCANPTEIVRSLLPIVRSTLVSSALILLRGPNKLTRGQHMHHSLHLS